MAAAVQLDRLGVTACSVSSLCVCPCRPYRKALTIPTRQFKLNLALLHRTHGMEAAGRLAVASPKIFGSRRILVAAIAREEESDPADIQEVRDDLSVVADEEALEQQRKASQLRKRIVFGVGIGFSVGGIVLAGGWVFTVALAAAVFVGAREYFELVRSKGITSGMTPPPRYVSRVCSVICALMPLLTLYFGHIDISVTSAAFVVAMALLTQKGIPRFSQLSSTMFGLFYCGFLPCFWVKLRCGLAAPALNTGIAMRWPILIGGPTHWTVGLLATLISVSCIIAADSFAFVGGRAFGRTPLTNISPKKTWEGAIAGLGGCIAISALLSRLFSWPASLLRAYAAVPILTRNRRRSSPICVHR